MELARPEAPPVPVLPRHRDIIIALILPCYRPIRLLFSIPWGPDGHWFSTLDMATSRSNSNPPSIRHPEQQFRYSDPILLSPHRAPPVPPAPWHHLDGGCPLLDEALPRRLDQRFESGSSGQDPAHRHVLLGSNVSEFFKLAFT